MKGCTVPDLEKGTQSFFIHTERLRLRSWCDADREAFAAMHAHPEVMVDYGGPISRLQSDAKLDRYAAAFHQYGFCRWAIERHDGKFLGYAGLMPSPQGHPLGTHVEIGWRLLRSSWGHGYATEASTAALMDAFNRVGLTEVIAYTAANNLRSQAVIERLGFQRDAVRDFKADYGRGPWHGLVWVARSVEITSAY